MVRPHQLSLLVLVAVGDASVLSVKRKRNPIEKKQSTVRHYCSNPLNMCTHNRNTGKVQSGKRWFQAQV